MLTFLLSLGLSGAPAVSPVTAPPTVGFDQVYTEHFSFVWRSLRRLGVRESHLDDATQEVFMVVHRRLSDFEGRSSVRTWLFGIALRVAKDHRRWLRRKDPHEELPETLADKGPTAFDQLARREAAAVLDGLLDAIPDERRAVFILVELEQQSAPEVAAALGIPLNTAYSRLRLAREDFTAALARYQRRTS